MNYTDNIEFSIIIPCFNVKEELIRRSLDSIYDQSYTEFEVIVVDDGSAEEFHDALVRLSNEYGGIKLITTKNNGVSEARNIGVSHAKGEYIAFVDADDVVKKNFLKEAHDALVKTKADFVIGGTKYVDNIVLLSDEHANNPEIEIYKGDDIRKLFCNLGCLRQTIRFEDSYVGRGPVSRVVRKSIADITPFRKGLIVGEDLLWNLEILSHCKSVCIVKSQWYLYWKNPNSALHRYNPNMYFEVKNAISMIEPLFNLSNDDEYLTFIYLIIDSIKTIRTSIFNFKSNDNVGLIRTIKKKFYSEWPWTKIEEKRFFRLSGYEQKILVIVYRLRFLLIYWELRNRKINNS